MQRSHRLELSVPLVTGRPGQSLYGEKISIAAGGGACQSAVLLSDPLPLRALMVVLLFPCMSDLWSMEL